VFGNLDPFKKCVKPVIFEDLYADWVYTSCNIGSINSPAAFGVEVKCITKY